MIYMAERLGTIRRCLAWIERAVEGGRVEGTGDGWFVMDHEAEFARAVAVLRWLTAEEPTTPGSLATRVGREVEILNRVGRDGVVSVSWATESAARARAFERLEKAGWVVRGLALAEFPFVPYRLTAPPLPNDDEERGEDDDEERD